MAVAILNSMAEVDSAREELERRSLSCLSTRGADLLRKLGIRDSIRVGDRLKSWDVLRTVRFLEQRVEPDAGVVDIGAYASEILCVLHRLGYTHLAGVDMNADLRRMPFANSITYQISDFMATPFPNAAFGAVTAISVIEHGFDAHRLLRESARILRPGGYFIASFDYWPKKLDTSSTPIFGMDWRIFSEDEVRDFIALSAEYGFEPAGPVDLDVKSSAIHWGGYDYTFAWLCLHKSQ